MNKQLAITKDWYLQHDMLPEFYKKYRCAECVYRDTCVGLSDEVRVECPNWIGGNTKFAPSSVWAEMSWHKFDAASKRSMQQRLRDGE